MSHEEPQTEELNHQAPSGQQETGTQDTISPSTSQTHEGPTEELLHDSHFSSAASSSDSSSMEADGSIAGTQ